jgi:hypothetical protein
MLGLVEHNRTLAGENFLPAGVQPGAFFRRFEVEIAPGQGAGEGGLPALTGSDQRDCGEVGQPVLQQTEQSALNHFLKIGNRFPFFKASVLCSLRVARFAALPDRRHAQRPLMHQAPPQSFDGRA